MKPSLFYDVFNLNQVDSPCHMIFKKKKYILDLDVAEKNFEKAKADFIDAVNEVKKLDFNIPLNIYLENHNSILQMIRVDRLEKVKEQVKRCADRFLETKEIYLSFD